MTGLEVKASAKINLSLDVLRKMENGYHELRMIMQTISLHDSVYLEKAASGIDIKCENSRVPQDKSNIAWKAASLLIERYGIRCGIRINIIKRIPVSAGLAGGSADAAAVLRGMNQLFSLGLDNSELRNLGVQLGADVPYCVEGGTKLAEGIGELLTDLPDFSGVDIVLVKPCIDVSTAWVYKNLNAGRISDVDRPDTKLICQAIGNRDIMTAAAAMKNVLEKVTIPAHPIVQEAKERLLEAGALGSMMSGSGPTVFGIFSDSNMAAKAFNSLSADNRWQVFSAKTS